MEVFILTNGNDGFLGVFETYERAEKEIEDNPHGKGLWKIQSETVEA